MSNLLTETAPYDEPGSWGRCSEGWPEIVGDEALELYRLANKGVIPYGSYVLMEERGQYNAEQSRLRVHPDHIETLKKASAKRISIIDGLSRLAPAELRVTVQVARGLCAKEIVRELNMTIGMVRFYTSSAMRRLGLKSRTQLALYYHGVINGPLK